MDLLELENPWQHRPLALRRGLRFTRRQGERRYNTETQKDGPQVGINAEESEYGRHEDYMKIVVVKHYQSV